MQSKTESLIEAAINTLIGFIIALISQLIIFPFYGIFIKLETNLMITFWFTLVSVVRSYCIRRWFNARIKSAIHNLSRGL